MREICYLCYRPCAQCLCEQLPRVLNRTQIVILQHPRERLHPFGSARMLVGGLSQVRLCVAVRGSGKAVTYPLRLDPGAALLYPRPNAVDLSALPDGPKPTQLVLLDGTWSQAHRLYRDNPELHGLPHLRFSPARPSRYLVRREPKFHCVSTLEAAVEALRYLEPDLLGLPELLAVFEQMNADQVALRRGRRGQARRKRARQREPRSLLGMGQESATALVAIYAETTELATRVDRQKREVLHWTAVRLQSGQALSILLKAEGGPPTEAHLRRLRLDRERLRGAVSTEQAIAQMSAFLRPNDVLLAWNGGTFKLLPERIRREHRCVQLKAAYCNWRGGRCGVLEDVIAREGLVPALACAPGRAGERLANAAAIARRLQEVAQGEPELLLSAPPPCA